METPMDDDRENPDLQRENTENPDLRLRLDELLAYQRELKEEKEQLQRMLERIDNQIHALLVEQLHLLGMENKSLQNSEKKPIKFKEEVTESEEESTSKTLDFSVPSSLKCYEEEEDD